MSDGLLPLSPRKREEAHRARQRAAHRIATLWTDASHRNGKVGIAVVRADRLEVLVAEVIDGTASIGERQAVVRAIFYAHALVEIGWTVLIKTDAPIKRAGLVLPERTSLRHEIRERNLAHAPARRALRRA